jgi:SSS family solute:Na+ symporter
MRIDVNVIAMLSAAMSTFDSIVNAAAAYWVKDIYQAYIHKKASQRVLMLNSRIASIIICALGVLITLTMKSVNDIVAFFSVSLAGGNRNYNN